MDESRDRDVSRRVLVVATLVFVAAACSGSVDGASSGADTSTSTAADSVEELVTTIAPGQTDQGDAAEYSVVMVANTDQLTAEGTLGSLETAGISGFVLEGSVEEGYDVYSSGMTYDEATDLLVEIFTAPEVNGGLIFETVNRP